MEKKSQHACNFFFNFIIITQRTRCFVKNSRHFPYLFCRYVLVWYGQCLFIMISVELIVDDTRKEEMTVSEMKFRAPFTKTNDSVSWTEFTVSWIEWVMTCDGKLSEWILEIIMNKMIVWTAMLLALLCTLFKSASRQVDEYTNKSRQLRPFDTVFFLVFFLFSIYETFCVE